MKIICFGAGAIGSYIGGSLQLTGNEITFIERQEAIPALKKNGVVIQSVNGETKHVQQVNVESNALEAIAREHFDLALIAVKSFDTQTLMESLKPVMSSLPPFISLQNGVENEALLAGYLGKDRVIPVSVCTAISRGTDGSIKVEKLRGIGIASGHALSQKFADECEKAGLKPGLIDDAIGMKWSKMISNLLSNAASAILDMTPAEVFDHPASFRLEIRQIQETLAVMRAMDIHPVNIPGVPIKALCWAVTYPPAFLSQWILKKAVGGGRGAKMPSFHIDLHAGRKQSEVEFLNGAVVREGNRLGIPVPVNQVYYQTLSAMTQGLIPLNAYQRQPEKLAEAAANLEKLK